MEFGVRRGVLALFILTAGTAAAASYGDAVQPLLRTHCSSCHSGPAPAGGFAVENLLRLTESETLGERDRWEQIARRMRGGEMPPMGAPQPDREQVSAVTDWIDAAYDRLDMFLPQCCLGRR
jgi:mono/diheme cytochrome c family protein